VQARSIDENKIMNKIRWNIVPYIMLLYIIAMLDRVNIGFAALDMNKELGISATVYGLLAGIFFVSYFFFEVPSNVLMHKVGARRWIARILITWGLVVVFMGAARSPTHIGILRFLLGVAEAGFYPCIILYFTFWFPAKHLAKTISLFMCGMAVANIIVGPISAWVMDNVHWMGLSGWRWMFILEGIPAIVLGFVTLFVLTDRPDQARFLTAEEKEWLLGELKAEYVFKKSKMNISKWKVLVQKPVWYLAWCLFCYNIATYGLGMWVPQIVRALSQILTNTEIGFISTLPYIVGVVVMLLVARHSDKTGERRLHTALPILLAFPALIALTLTNDLWISMALICVATAVIYAFIGTFWTLPNFILGEETAAVGVALISSVANLGGFFGPYVVGFLKDMSGTTNTGMYLLATFALLGTISVLAIPARTVDTNAFKRQTDAKVQSA